MFLNANQWIATHSHARNGAHLMQWKTQALQHIGPSVLLVIGLELHVQ